jgi:putative oxygen-independent coproporphyrinogen III oxidase
MMSRSPECAVPRPGIYLHVPFCAHRCHYCDFNTYAGFDGLMPRYVAALRADVRAVAAAGPPGGGDWQEFGSVFVGGGTPTLLAPHDLAGVLRLVRDVLPLASDAEVTVEANPETVTVEGVAVLVEAGMNRLSMGAQSFAPHVLAALGRRHDADRPLLALADARAAGVRRINLDLIYGTPGETDADWEASLRTVLEAGIRHVSAYALTVEPATEYAARIRAGLAREPDEDAQATRMAVADQTLSAAGLRRYEISNWAQPGEECRHNLVYWRGGNWLGVGAGAHGHWAGRRWWSLRSPSRYAEAALSGQSTIAGEEILDEGKRRTERLMLGLRLAEGVELSAVQPVDEAQLRTLSGAGLITVERGRLRLTDQGWPVANAITLRLLHTLASQEHRNAALPSA